MKITAKQAYCIEDVIGGGILTTTGEITLSFFLEQPEAYAFDIEDIESRHNEFYRAFQYIRFGFIHKQDLFFRRQLDAGKVIRGESFIQNAEKAHFKGREYLQHLCILNFTLSGLGSLEKAYQANPLSYKEQLTKNDREKLSDFLEGVESAVAIIRNMKDTKISALSTTDVKRYIFQFTNGFYEDDGLRDIQFADQITIGQKKGMFFSVCDERYLPDKLKTYIPDQTLQSANSRLYCSMLERLGIHLECTHVVNQIWQMAGNSYREELADRVRKFGRYQEFDKNIKKKYQSLSDYEQEIVNEENVLCKTHFNVMLLEDDPNKLDRAIDYVKNVFTNAGFKYYIPAFEGLYNMYLGNVIGRESNLDRSYLYLTDLHSSLCLMLHYSNYKSDADGILFNDRIFQIPIRKDIWDAKKKRIPARNSIIIAPTGGGKSVTALNIVQQKIEAGYKMIVVEFGKSFFPLYQLYRERSVYVDYDGTQPLGINPFDLAGQPLTNEKLKTLVNLVLKYWRSPSIMEDTKQVVSLTKIIKAYYENGDERYSFPGLYAYIKGQGERLYDSLNILPDYFDLNSFLHVCSEFMPGGFYENVCKPSDLENKIRESDFSLFELTKIKKDPFLSSVIMTTLYDTVENKILSDRSIRGEMFFDEYAESQAIRDVFSGVDIHSTVAFFYQKLRKENGAITTIVQSPAQLPDNEYTKGIIANTQILYVLPATEVVYDQVIEAFHIKNQSHINLMKSIRNDFSGVKPHSEIFMRFLDTYATVVRLELSKEKFLAFQTDGEDWNNIQALYKETGNMATAIQNYKSVKYQSYEKEMSL